jgi:hypothetical protein
MTKLNVKLLRKIKKHVEEEPRRLIMARWQQKGRAGELVEDEAATFNLPECGTAACIAGWAVNLSGKKIETDVGARAMTLLGLTFEQSQNLFNTGNWPGDYGDKFDNETSPERRVKILGKLIDKVIESKGAVLTNKSASSDEDYFEEEDYYD